ncbi:MAG TPA: phage holin family protein [Elusimicrobiota bacterium]|jgi:putative membrane protein|nr:phage holin family protein [Elusimicrobiota bacterium]
MRILAHILISAIAVFAAAHILPGVSVAAFSTALIVAVVLGVVNVLLRPLLLLLTLPLNVLTLGLFTFVIIGGLVELTAAVVPGFHVASFLWAMAFGVTLGVINAVLHGLGV